MTNYWPTSDDPRDCECERWRDGTTWCPYHREMRIPRKPTNSARLVRIIETARSWYEGRKQS